MDGQHFVQTSIDKENKTIYVEVQSFMFGTKEEREAAHKEIELFEKARKKGYRILLSQAYKTKVICDFRKASTVTRSRKPVSKRRTTTSKSTR